MIREKLECVSVDNPDISDLLRQYNPEMVFFVAFLYPTQPASVLALL